MGRVECFNLSYKQALETRRAQSVDREGLALICLQSMLACVNRLQRKMPNTESPFLATMDQNG